MLNRIRHLAAAFATAGLALMLAVPARADRMYDSSFDETSTPMVFVDAIFLRPIGLITVLVGGALYLFPVAPIVAVTRPTQIAEPLGPLVGVPVSFTFKDPLGHHPKRWGDSNS